MHRRKKKEPMPKKAKTDVIDPSTPEEWQDAVNAAEYWLLVHSAVCYGLVEYSGTINVDRCDAILKAGAELGIRPTIKI
jgi:hypothetical protein